MRPLRLGVIVLAVTEAVGCRETSARVYYHAAVETTKPGPSHYDVVPGASAVLELASYRGVPLPDAWGGFTLLLKADSGALQPGRLVPLPDSAIISYLSVLHAPSTDTTTSLEGHVRIVGSSQGNIEAEISLRALSLDWSYDDRVRFRQTPLSCFGKNERYVRARGAEGCK
jgi:hypothetical protein